MRRKVVYRHVDGVLGARCLRAAPSPAPAGTPYKSIVCARRRRHRVIGTRRQSPFMMFELSGGRLGASVTPSSIGMPRFRCRQRLSIGGMAAVWVREHAHEYGATPDALIVGARREVTWRRWWRCRPASVAFSPALKRPIPASQERCCSYGVYDFESRQPRAPRSCAASLRALCSARYHEKAGSVPAPSDDLPTSKKGAAHPHHSWAV